MFVPVPLPGAEGMTRVAALTLTLSRGARERRAPAFGFPLSACGEGNVGVRSVGRLSLAAACGG